MAWWVDQNLKNFQFFIFPKAKGGENVFLGYFLDKIIRVNCYYNSHSNTLVETL